MFTYTMEQELHDHLIENFSDYFNFNHVASEMVIPVGRVDILGEDSSTIYVVELKRKEVDLKSIRQVNGYLPYFREKHPGKKVVGIVAAPSINKDVDVYKLPLDIKVKTLDNVHCNIPEFTGNSGLRNRGRFSTTVDVDLLEGLRQLSEDTMVPISKLLDQAFTCLIEEYEQRASQK